MLKWHSKIRIKKIRSEGVKKNWGAVVRLNVLVAMSSPKSVVGDPQIKRLDSLLMN